MNNKNNNNNNNKNNRIIPFLSFWFVLIIGLLGLNDKSWGQWYVGNMYWTNETVAAGSWTPATVPGLYAWWDATDLAGADNDPLTTWTDKKSGIVLYNLGAPTLKTTINRGKKAMKTAATGGMTNAADYTVTQPTEIFMVVSNFTGYIYDGITSTRQTLWAAGGKFNYYYGSSRVSDSVPASETRDDP